MTRPVDSETGRAFFRDATLFVCALMPAQPGKPPRSALLAFAMAREATAAAREQALEFARHAVARHYAIVFEKVALNSDAWPAREPVAASDYVVERDGYIALAPSIDTWVHMPPKQPHQMVQLLAAWPDGREADAHAFLGASDSCSMIGRVCAIVQCDSGAEIDAVVASPERLVGGRFAAKEQTATADSSSTGEVAASPAAVPGDAVAAVPLDGDALLNAALTAYIAPFANTKRLAGFLQQQGAIADADPIRAQLDAVIAGVTARLWDEPGGVLWSEAFVQDLRRQLTAQHAWLAPIGLGALFAYARWLCWHEGLNRPEQ